MTWDEFVHTVEASGVRGNDILQSLYIANVGPTSSPECCDLEVFIYEDESHIRWVSVGENDIED